MQGRIADYPTRIYVSSESESGVEFLVDLTAHPVKTAQGTVFNGSCGRSDLGAIGCRHFLFKCEPRLKERQPDKLYRCKHIAWARALALDFVLPHMKASDPNPDEHQQI